MVGGLSILFVLFQLFFPTPTVNTLDPTTATQTLLQSSNPTLNPTTIGKVSSTEMSSQSNNTPSASSTVSAPTTPATATIATPSVATATTAVQDVDVGAQHNAATSLLESMRIHGLLPHGASKNPEFSANSEGPAEKVKFYLKNHFVPIRSFSCNTVFNNLQVYESR